MSGAHIAAHAAAERRSKQQEEEERMTRYTSEDTNGDWEFKIVRSASNQFKKAEVFQQMVAEESLAGWQLLEKLDDGRVRFKRPISARKRDAMLSIGVDPYRTQYGISEGTLGITIAVVVLLALGILIFIIMLAENGGLNF